jgi:predicted N-acetyltransferase YhbS
MGEIRLMTSTDIPAALRLCAQAGWNQTTADWQRMLVFEPEGCFVAEQSGTVIGTTTTTVFRNVAWLAMVLVDASARGRGIGTALVQRALDFLQRQAVTTVRLDATPLGRPLYDRLGFVEQFQVARWVGTVIDTARPIGVEPAMREQLEALGALDETVTGTNRRRLLQRLFSEQPGSMRCLWQEGRLLGFLASRPRKGAQQIGPCIATPDAGPLLLADAWHRYRGHQVFIDVPVSNAAATSWVQAAGLTVERHLVRMCRGVPVGERVSWLWASSGPEKG